MLLSLAGWSLIVASLAGCDGQPAGRQSVPPPVDLLLPREIRIHSFTTAKVFEEDGSKGIEVHIEARDAFGDPTKAFGDYRFELYEFRPQHPQPKGAMLASWTEKLGDPKDNALHWRRVSRTYVFNLRYDRPMPPGRKFILEATYSSPFTDRLFAEREFVAGR